MALTPPIGLTLVTLVTLAAPASPLPAPGAPQVDAIAGKPELPQELKLLPPEPLTPTEVPYPPAAPPHTELLEVQVAIDVDHLGEVQRVRLQRGVGEPFDSAVLIGATGFRFRPATYGGHPVAVEISFSQAFLPQVPEQEEGPEGPARDAVLAGLVAERGTRKPVRGAIVVATAGGEELLATTDDEGEFRLALRAGAAEVRIVASGYRKFRQQEELAAHQRVQVKYLIDRLSYDPYETLVIGTRERTEINRTALKGREIKRVPGTFGDPFRVVGVMPGVSQAMGLLPLPIVRGSSPGNTGFLLDGVALPFLYHLLFGPAVVHPEFIDRIDFYPGVFPVSYGGYTGGIVDGLTRSALPDESRYEVNINLLQTGLFVREGVESLGLTGAAAGRIGYPGLLMDLLNSPASLGYWDYQTRVDGGDRDNGWSAFIIGARDEIEVTVQDEWGNEVTETAVRLQFHRAETRYHHASESLSGEYRLLFGWEETLAADGAFATTSWLVTPRARWQLTALQSLRLRLGLEASLRDAKLTLVEERMGQGNDQGGDPTDGPQAFGQGEDPQRVFSSEDMYIGGAWLEALWQPVERLLMIPGLRADLYAQNNETRWDLDPRLLVRYRLFGSERDGTWLKGGLGFYHQPPRFFIPLPGLAETALDVGLLASVQGSLGAEVPLGIGLSIDVQGYYNHMDPVLFDLTISPSIEEVQTQGPRAPPGELPPPTLANGGLGSDGFGGSLVESLVGRSYGVELLLRKRDSERLFGWIAYTLSRTERLRVGQWTSFDFDRLHIFNLVAGIRLPRNWELGLRVLFQTGTPLTTFYGYDTNRTGPQFRLDIRIDKRAVWDQYLLDFYVDVINVTVAPESGGILGGESFHYLLPTVGLRGVL